MELNNYNYIVINSSGGKDSICAMFEVMRLVEEQNFPLENILVSHQDLGKSEWKGTGQLVQEQADMWGLPVEVTRRRNKDGYEESFLEYAQRRQKWPSSTQRWCTSDFKRNVGARTVTALTKGQKGVKVLYVFGFRWSESPARSKKEYLAVNKYLTTKSREVFDWCPILHWSDKKVWDTIHGNNLPYHKAYDLGMPRLSCVFCIFSPFDALVLAGKHNRELLQEYVAVEAEIGHTFRKDCSLASVLEAVDAGYEPKRVDNWHM